MSDNDREAVSELVIIRRGRRDEEGGHHGGVWKIAYADFMTAMMAFFLVMWLINAANEETRSQVASYFNPMRLTDSITNPKGLQEMDSGARGKEDKFGNSPKPEDKDSTKFNVGKSPVKSDDLGMKSGSNENLPQEPDNANGQRDHSSLKADQIEKTGEESRTSGEAYRDPFDPSFWRQTGVESTRHPKATREAAPGGPLAATDSGPKPQNQEEPSRTPNGNGSDRAASHASKTVPAKPNAGASKRVARMKPETGPESISKTLEAQIRKALKQSGPGPGPRVETRKTGDGLLVSLIDNNHAPMFGLSSAKPSSRLVAMIGKIARILRKRPGKIQVRGHTDGRPFQTGTSNNWKLSMERAYVAYDLLRQGGMAEDRFERIEGRADRDLKIANNPMAAQNRRIEILLREPRP